MFKGLWGFFEESGVFWGYFGYFFGVLLVLWVD
jgi:hypothetical protein